MSEELFIIDIDRIVEDTRRFDGLPDRFRLTIGRPSKIISRFGEKEIRYALGDYTYFPNAKPGQIWLRRER